MQEDYRLKLLSKSERTLVKNRKKGEVDKLAKTAIVKNTLLNYLNTEIVETLPDGTTVTHTALEMIVASAITDAINKGSLNNLVTLSNLLGENIVDKKDINVNVSLVNQELRERALKNDEKDTGR